MDGSGMLSFGELRVSLEHLEISVKEAAGDTSNGSLDFTVGRRVGDTSGVNVCVDSLLDIIGLCNIILSPIVLSKNNLGDTDMSSLER